MPRTYIYINLLHRSTLYKLANCSNFIYAWIESTTLPVCSCKVPDSRGAEGVGRHSGKLAHTAVVYTPHKLPQFLSSWVCIPDYTNGYWARAPNTA